MYEYMTYEKAEKKYGLKNHNRRCIDGKITGCGNCVGYCMYCEHSGFLTKELRREHNCIGKQCRHYIEKSYNKEMSYNPFENILKSRKSSARDVFEMACSMTDELEGLRIMAADFLDNLVCELSYVTISNDYELEPIIKRIQAETGLTVKTKMLNYSFENAVELVIRKTCA